MLLNGKTAVISGCLRGIGRTTMDIFAENGANIFACAQMEDVEFSSHIEEIAKKYGVSITPIYFDLMDENAVKLGMKKILSAKQPIDILVNNAGMAYNALFQMTSIEKMRDIFEVDFFSQMLITQSIVRVMLKQKSGSIINISSIAGIDGNAGQIAYSAAKAALIGATKTMALELGSSGIRVNAVAPGVIDTDMTRSLPDEIKAELIAPASIPRLGTKEEVAKVLLYLGSDLSEYVTGQVIRIDGGIGC